MKEDWRTNTSQGANSIDGNPVFTDASNDDFTLQAGSEALNRGVDVSLTSDFVGTTVPIGAFPDMGAYESQFSSTKVNMARKRRMNY